MKNIKMLLILALAVLAPLPAIAQTTTAQTTLTNTLTDTTSTSVTLGSITGLQAGTWGIYIDKEMMNVRTVPTSGLTVQVLRATGGTRAAPHLANAIVWAGPNGASGPFSNNNGTVPQPAPGACTRGNLLYAPQINVSTGDIWDCILSTTATTSQWTHLNLSGIAPVGAYKKLAVTATTYTALPTDYIIGYNTNVNGTITLPALTGMIGKQYIIQNEVTGTASLTIATSSTQTINGASTMVLGGTSNFVRAILYFDGVSKWFAMRGN
jgi:hypothetical protein